MLEELTWKKKQCMTLSAGNIPKKYEFKEDKYVQRSVLVKSKLQNSKGKFCAVPLKQEPKMNLGDKHTALALN